jgi:hypothetical protein
MEDDFAARLELALLLPPIKFFIGVRRGFVQYIGGIEQKQQGYTHTHN